MVSSYPLFHCRNGAFFDKPIFFNRPTLPIDYIQTMRLDSHIFAVRTPGVDNTDNDTFPTMHFVNFPGLDMWVREKWINQGKPLINSAGTLVKYAETENEADWFHKYVNLEYEDLLQLHEAMELNMLDYTDTVKVDEKINDLRNALDTALRAFPNTGPILYTSTFLPETPPLPPEEPDPGDPRSLDAKTDTHEHSL